MDEYVPGTWQQSETWIRNTIGSDFRWKMRPLDNAPNRQIVAELIVDAIERNNGTFPESNSFIERI